jgi:large subunit ribosomal protein L18e
LHRLVQSRTIRHPISLKRIVRVLPVKLTVDKDKKENSVVKEGVKARATPIIVIIATVTDDVRLLKLPDNLKICALRFTERAKRRIETESKGGEALTLDELAIRAPTGRNTILLRGKKSSRKAERYFGKAPGFVI